MSRPSSVSTSVLFAALLSMATLGSLSCGSPERGAPPVPSATPSAPAAAAAPKAPAAPAAPAAPSAPAAPAAGDAMAADGKTDAKAAPKAEAKPAADEKPAAPAKPRVVVLEINGNLSEDPAPPNPLGPSRKNFRDQLLMLRKLAADPTVAGVQLEIDSTPDFARSLDLLEELRQVRAAGKRIVCWEEMLDQRTLIYASLADHLAMPPGALIGLEGLAAEAMYFKDLLTKLELRMEVVHVGDFKTGYEELGRSTMSDEQRQTIGALLDEFYGQMLDTIAQNRRMARPALEELFKQVVVLPDAARTAGLIDAVSYKAEFDAQVRDLFGGEVELVKNYGEGKGEDLEAMLASPFAIFSLLPKLLNPPKLEAPKEPYVAVVYASGTIMSGKSQAGWDGRVTTMGSDTIVAALETVEKDDNCKAVVLRVNSPGGSALASDAIWGAIERVKAKKKPVVSSMGYVAGSGGYWISMGCTAIVAQPSTITGSIGVLSLLPDLSKALTAIGVNVEVVARGPHGDQLSLLKHGPTPLLRQTVQRIMQRTYDEFLDKVAAGRKLPREKVAQLARGRVYTGRQAEALGLVDELGGLQDAIDMAAVLGGLTAAAPLHELPEPPNMMEAIQEAMGDFAHVRSPLSGQLTGAALAALPALLALPGVPEFLQLVESQLGELQPLHPDRVQCLMPFSLSIR
ncbi:MAG: signal peptide peptidase SppA [Planctomycetota bacterium]